MWIRMDLYLLKNLRHFTLKSEAIAQVVAQVAAHKLDGQIEAVHKLDGQIEAVHNEVHNEVRSVALSVMD
jgi:hypothetical protein